ncbi:MAG: beta-propeller fold lactonase family protein [Rhabdochlamydiaceae bacterium]|jgi:YVTN family beta-propeller protein
MKKAAQSLFISALFFSSTWLHGVCDQAWIGDNEGNVAVIDTDTQMETSLFQPGDSEAVAMAFTPDGLEVFLVDIGMGVYVIDAATQTTIAMSLIEGTDVVISPNGQFAYIPFFVGADGFILQVNTMTLAENFFPAVGAYPSPLKGITITPDGSTLFVTTLNEVLVVDASNGNLLTTIPIPGTNLVNIAITPDGSYVYVIAAPPSAPFPTVYQINTSTFAVNAVSTVGFPAFASPGGIAISPNGQFAYVTDSANESVYVINISTNSVIKEILNPSFMEPTAIAITPDGSFLYVANFGTTGMVSIINTSTFAITTMATGDTGQPLSIAMSPSCAAPSGPVTGKVCKNEDFWQTEIFSAISWNPPLNFTPVEYQIFRNGVLIDTVSSSQLSFKQHDLKKNKTYVYSIYAVNNNDVTLFIGSVSLRT